MLSLLMLLSLSGCGAVANVPPAVQPPANFNPVQSLAPLVESVQPAVVAVYVTATQQFNVPPAWQMFGVPTERTVEGQGSGFVISSDGYILTNNHVIGEADTIKVKFDGGEEFVARVIGSDASSDVALIKIDAGRALPYLQLGDSDVARVGDWVLALGNPLGLGHTVTSGIVSGKGRELSDQLYEQFLQTDASINPGNSGGPLVGLDGKVLGMNTAIIQGANSVGFAIPANYINQILPQLRKDGKVSRGYLGVEMAPLTDQAKDQLGLDHGVYLARLAEGGPAALGGLRAGDILLEVNNEKIDDTRDLQRTVGGLEPGRKVAVTVLRSGKSLDLQVELGERPETPTR